MIMLSHTQVKWRWGQSIKAAELQRGLTTFCIVDDKLRSHVSWFSTTPAESKGNSSLTCRCRSSDRPVKHRVCAESDTLFFTFTSWRTRDFLLKSHFKTCTRRIFLNLDLVWKPVMVQFSSKSSKRTNTKNWLQCIGYTVPSSKPLISLFIYSGFFNVM